SVGARLLERGLIHVAVVQEHSTTVSETIPLEAPEESPDPLLVFVAIPTGVQHLKPKHIVPQVGEPEEILQKTAPMPATLRLARKGSAICQYDTDRGQLVSPYPTKNIA